PASRTKRWRMPRFLTLSSAPPTARIAPGEVSVTPRDLNQAARGAEPVDSSPEPRMARWERKEIVLRTNATGHPLTAPLFVCHGRNERPLAYVQANVHGGELQGNAVIVSLFETLERDPPRGSVVLVPRVNPVAANQQIGDYVAGVYDFQTGVNFNRGYLYL